MKSAFLDSSWDRHKRLAVWTAVAFLFYTVVGFFLLPPLARALAAKELSQQLGRAVSIKRVRFNPYTFSAALEGLVIHDKDGVALISWEAATLDFRLVSLFSHAWVFKEISVIKPFVRIQVNKDYTLNFAELVDRLFQSTASGSIKTGPLRPWRINRLRIVGGKVSFADLTPRTPFRRMVDPLEATLTNFQTTSNHKNYFALSGISAGGERFSWSGSFRLAPFRSEGQIWTDGVSLTTYAPLYQELFRFEIQDGVVSFHLDYRYQSGNATNLLAITNATFELKSMRMVEKETGQPIAGISDFLVTGGSIDAMARQAEADTVTLSGGRLFLRRNKDTSVNAIELLKPADSAPPAPGGILLLLRAMTNVVAMLVNTTNLSNGAVRDLSLTNCALHLEDLANSEPVRLDLRDIAVQGTNISNRAGSNMTARVSLRWDATGTVRADIKATLSPADAEVTLAFDNLNLRPLAPYLEPQLDVFVLGSKLGLAGKMRLRRATSELPEVRFQGDAWLDDFSTAEGVATEGLLRWNSLRLSGVEASLNPPVVSVNEARLEDVFARLIIETNRTLNLMSALRRGGLGDATAPPLNNLADTAVRPRVSVASVIISNANVQFIDRSLRPSVNISLEQLCGMVSGLSSDDPQRADIHLYGVVDKTARADITGKINPWNSKQPLNLKLVLRDMDLRPEDPYAAKYLGYRLEQGRLSAQLSYQFTERRLESENRLTLDQLALGRKVESAEATRLPVRLAIALLKDRDGRIALEIPVSGSLEDPQFNPGRVAYRAIQTVMARLVTSPFSALSAVFEGKGEELGFQEFEPGSTNLLPGAMAKLDALAKGLFARPELRLEIEGSFDPLTDLEALRRAEVSKQSPRQEGDADGSLFRTGSDPASALTPSAGSARRVVAFEKGASALRSPRACFPNLGVKATSTEGYRPRAGSRAFAEDKGSTALMLVSAPSGGAADPTWGGQLLKPVELDPNALRTLAVERARNVRAYLLQTGRVEPERITSLPELAGSKGSRVYVRLQ